MTNMKAASIQELDQQTIVGIIDRAQSLIERCYADPWKTAASPSLLGTLFHNIPPNEVRITRAAAQRLGMGSVDFGLHEEFTMNDEETLLEVDNICSVADSLVGGFVDFDTFGKGRELVEKVADRASIPFVSIRDDIYSNQSALAELLAMKSHFGKIDGLRVTISWGFGTRFHLPSTPHSILLLGAAMGAHVRVASPPEFPLLKRVVKKARELSGATGGNLVEVSSFPQDLADSDVVWAMNWSRLDDFAHPERHAQHASEFKNWHFTEEILPPECLFLTEPPVQTDLIANQSILTREQKIAHSWLARRVAILASSIVHSAMNEVALF